MCFISLHLVSVSAQVKLIILQHLTEYFTELNSTPSDVLKIVLHKSLSICL